MGKLISLSALVMAILLIFSVTISMAASSVSADDKLSSSDTTIYSTDSDSTTQPTIDSSTTEITDTTDNTDPTDTSETDS